MIPISAGDKRIRIDFTKLLDGDAFKPTEAFSFQVSTEDQAETDKYWNAIVKNGGQESMCSWCKDKFGVSWKIVPRALDEAINDTNKAAAKRAMEAMMTMKKIDIAKIKKAQKGWRQPEGLCW